MGQVTLKVQAPFTADQVSSLNNYQASGVMHPFTCGVCRDRLGTYVDGRLDDRLLVATLAGWICPTCDGVQTWAWDWMADWRWESLQLPGVRR